jgi:predicted lipid-binding transport protein (Tim44 family)
MRHMMMGGMMGGGMMGFMLHGMIRRMITSIMIIGLLAVVAVLWTRLHQERQRNRNPPPGWD